MHASLPLTELTNPMLCAGDRDADIPRQRFPDNALAALCLEAKGAEENRGNVRETAVFRGKTERGGFEPPVQV
jgi:hypothetical protein